MNRSSAFLLATAALLVAHPLFAQSIPEIRFESEPDLLSMPDDIYLGEALGHKEIFSSPTDTSTPE